MKRLMIYVLLSLVPLTMMAQMIDNGAAYRNLNSDRYIRLNYDNDFFTATDEYYTQGINLEMVHPALRYFPLSPIMIHLRNGEQKYGLAIEHNGYTSIGIGFNQIPYGNRPYAGVLLLKTFRISEDREHHQRLYSAFSAGVIGPASGADGMQKGIHEALHNLLPEGWKYQIHNDAAINYEVNYEHNIFTLGHTLEMNVGGGARIGTLYDKANAGLTLMAGHFNSAYQNDRPHAFNMYLYINPLVNLVGYDATLQGGVFNRTSPYTISAANMSRVVPQVNSGIVLSFKKFYAEYSISYLGKEFSTGKQHYWGGIHLGIGF